ncbi:MAG: enoyl-CoA hydratase, partial [Xanthomonadaceae bacterium]|nr:enoyl-CoA hydratase [Xanthomonadaceae bacterium]
AATALAGQLAKAAVESVRGILQAMDLGLDGTIDQGIALETARFALCCSTGDMREGTAAFLEKRPPRFSGD